MSMAGRSYAQDAIDGDRSEWLIDQVTVIDELYAHRARCFLHAGWRSAAATRSAPQWAWNRRPMFTGARFLVSSDGPNLMPWPGPGTPRSGLTSRDSDGAGSSRTR